MTLIEDKVAALIPDGVDGYVKGLGWVTAKGFGAHGSGDDRERYTYAYATDLPDHVCTECGVSGEGTTFRHSLACSLYQDWLNAV